MRWRIACLPAALLAGLLPLLAAAQPRTGPDPAGVFDYYLLAISWTPSWCASEGDRRRDARCAPGSGMALALHGLWPQHEAGWPEYCRTPHRDPTRSETAAMADLTGSSGLAWHQWNRHGRCSGLSAQGYFDLMRAAMARIALPALAPPAARRIAPASLAAEVRAANPGMPSDGLVVTCRAGRIEEVRICLTRDLEPRPCGSDVLQRACRARMAELPPIR